MPVPESYLAFLYPDAAVTEPPRWQQRDIRTRNALIQSLRGLGERGFALLPNSLGTWPTPMAIARAPPGDGRIGLPD